LTDPTSRRDAAPAEDINEDRDHQIRRAATAGQLQRMLQGRPLGVRGGADRQRLQDRRGAGGAQEAGISVLRLRHQAADPLRARQPQEDLRGRFDPAFPYYGSSIKKQTRYILNNLKRTFEAAGSSLDQVVKAQVFLTDLNDFCAFDEVWKEFFKNPPPRSTVGTSGLLIDGCRIEIDLIGVVG
jgi:Endoribonuclease L-PSP